jgi:hypothetical protein
MQRLRLGELIAGAGGVALLAVMWAPWFDDKNAWGSFVVTDVVLAVAALLGIALAVLQATRTSPAWPVVADVIGTVVGFIALVLLLIRLLDPPADRAWGAFIGFVSCLAVLVGAWLAMRTE